MPLAIYQNLLIDNKQLEQTTTIIREQSDLINIKKKKFTIVNFIHKFVIFININFDS